MLGEAKELLEMIKTLSEWIAQAKQQRKAESEQRAAVLLGTAGILVASLRTLDNSFREVMSDLRLFNVDWTAPRRDAVRERINRFAEQEKILPHIRESLEVLTRTVARNEIDPKQKQPVQVLIGCATRILNAIGRDVTPFPSKEILVRFLDDIHAARTAVEAEVVRVNAQRHLSVLERRILAEADIAFADLKEDILARNPGLPDPGWAVAL
jgi:hypothetical protein